MEQHERSYIVTLIDRLLMDVEAGCEKLSVNNFSQGIEKCSIKEIATLQKEFKELDERTKDIKAVFYKIFDHLRINVLPDKMDEEGYEGGLVIKDVGRIKLTADVHATIPKQNKEAAFQWLKDNGHDLIKETVNATSFKALANRLLRNNDPLPEDLFKVSPFTRASITKS